MAEVQRYFKNFHERIRLKNLAENAILREKRDIVLDKLRERLQKLFEERGETAPTFTHFNKGSYAMNTGVVPIDCDYDIDVGLLFDIHIDDYPDPVVVKQWVYEALDGHTDNVVIKQPCVTVYYHLKGEPIYHIDLAVYARTGNSAGNIYLARGKPHSSQERRVWQLDDPMGLTEIIRNRFDNEDERKQFRRIIRYLKRWKNIQFPLDGNAAPMGIGITVAAYYWFLPQRTLIDAFQNKYKDDDLKALSVFVNSLINNFRLTYNDDEFAERLNVQLPVQPYNDLFEKMTNLQMLNFKQKLKSLRTVLDEATQETDPVKACKKLQKQFGDDFPVPEISETAQQRSPAIVSSSASA